MTAIPAIAQHVATPIAQNVEDEGLRSNADSSAHSGTIQVADPNAANPMPSVGRVGLALVVVLGGILLMRAAARKFLLLPGGAKSNRAVRVLSRSILSPKQHVLLLHVGKRVLVVGDSAGKLSSLSEISDPDEVASLLSQVQNDKAEPIKAGFGKMFGKATESFAEPEPYEEIVDRPKEPSVAAVGGDEMADLGQLLERVRSMQQQLR